MRLIRQQIQYIDQEFRIVDPDPVEVIEKYNKSKKRFLFYLWGIWITCFSRYSTLKTCVIGCGKDYVYSDTDSGKIIDPEKHLEVFEEYNKEIREIHYKCLDFYGIPRDRVEPETVKGKKKLLGAFEFEHDGKPFTFKTLGAKRYMVYDEESKEFEITVAGLAKKEGKDYLLSLAGPGASPEDVFDLFSDDLDVPDEKTGKLTHTYIDEEMETVLTDMFGETRRVYEKSCIHLSPCPFHLSLSKDFMDFLLGMQGGYGLYVE